MKKGLKRSTRTALLLVVAAMALAGVAQAATANVESRVSHDDMPDNRKRYERRVAAGRGRGVGVGGGVGVGFGVGVGVGRPRSRPSPVNDPHAPSEQGGMMYDETEMQTQAKAQAEAEAMAHSVDSVGAATAEAVVAEGRTTAAAMTTTLAEGTTPWVGTTDELMQETDHPAAAAATTTSAAIYSTSGTVTPGTAPGMVQVDDDDDDDDDYTSPPGKNPPRFPRPLPPIDRLPFEEVPISPDIEAAAAAEAEAVAKANDIDTLPVADVFQDHDDDDEDDGDENEGGEGEWMDEDENENENGDKEWNEPWIVEVTEGEWGDEVEWAASVAGGSGGGSDEDDDSDDDMDAELKGPDRPPIERLPPSKQELEESYPPYDEEAAEKAAKEEAETYSIENVGKKGDDDVVIIIDVDAEDVDAGLRKRMLRTAPVRAN